MRCSLEAVLKQDRVDIWRNERDILELAGELALVDTKDGSENSQEMEGLLNLLRDRVREKELSTLGGSSESFFLRFFFFLSIALFRQLP